MSLLLRGMKDAAQRKAFNEVRKAMLERGLKTDLPLTAKEYIASYTGRKKDARSDYYFEWSRVMRDFYNELGKRAARKNKKYGLDLKTRTEYVQKVEQKEGVTAALNNIAEGVGTLVHFNHRNYAKSRPSKKFMESLVGGRNQQGEVNRAGIRGAKIEALGNSRIFVAYNNYLVSLTHLGYTKTLNTVYSMGPAEWWRIFKDNSDILEVVYMYHVNTAGKDDDFNDFFLGAKSYGGEVSMGD